MKIVVDSQVKSNIKNRKSKIRNAFTLVELLVVIAIISILAGLLLPAISKVSFYMDEVRTLAEIQELAGAAEQFKSIYGQYMPSRIVLRERGGYLPADQESIQALRSMFTGIDVDLGDPATSPTPLTAPGLHWHDWNGDGMWQDQNGQQVFVLEGDECLAYFLGGVPYSISYDSTNGVVPLPPEQVPLRKAGFCKDKAHPTLFTASRTREGPFYDFDSNRLRGSNQFGDSNTTAPAHLQQRARHTNFLVYFDIYAIGSARDSTTGQLLSAPYAYFKAGPGTFSNYRFGTSNDCRTICGDTFRPYSEADPISGTVIQYHKPSTFQIVSAGRDINFGGGGQYPLPPGGAAIDGNDAAGRPTDFDKDNLTNFGEGRLETRR